MNQLAEFFAGPLAFKVPLFVGTVGWLVVEKISCVVSEMVFKEAFTSLTKQEKTRWGVQCVAGLHALVICPLCAYILLFTSELTEDRFYGHNFLADVLLCITSSYFIFDMVVVIRDRRDVRFSESVVFFFHGLAAFLSFSPCLAPMLQYYATFFLLYELSTPCLNVRQNMLLLKMSDTKLFAWMEKGFFFIFGLVRIGVGLPSTVFFWIDMLACLREGRQQNTAVYISILTVNILLNVLNVYWFTLMIKKVVKSLRGGGGKKKKALDSTATSNGEVSAAVACGGSSKDE